MIQQNKKSNVLTICVIAFIVFIITSVVLYWGVLNHDRSNGNTLKIDGMYLAKPMQIDDFNVVDNHGKPFDKNHLKGHWSMLFFGFTNCGMVCPTTLAELNKMYQDLAKQLPSSQMPEVILISVDPDRDSVERINSYVHAFNPNFIGLRGEEAQIAKLKNQLHIVSAKMKADGEGKNHYTINHSAEIMLFNPDAQLQAFMAYPHKAEQMAADYKAIITFKKG